ncbi:MAG: hypothetical protein M5R40_26515 [Anaerolineae bacterium]|nr:hypothetical protein [Anaerolineae bacterium]
MSDRVQSSHVRIAITTALLLVVVIGLTPPASQAQTAGGQIAFASNSIDSDGDGFVTTRDLASLFVANPDGTGLTQVTDGASLDLEPVWSPQGDRIAFVSRIDTNNDGVIDALNDTASLDVINADGSNRLPLVSDTLNATQPTWAPDGNRLAFVSRRDVNEDGVINSADPGAIYIVDGGGGGLKRISPDDLDATDPDWSRDGTRVVFSGVKDTNGDGVIDKNTGDTASLYVVTLEDSAVAQITEDDSSDFGPRWSPDGSKIAFVSFRRDDTADGLITPADVPSVTVVDADGGNRRQLTDDEYIDFDPRWSPDGALIAFRSYRIDTDGDGAVTINDAPGIYKVSAQGGNLVMLSDPAGAAERPTWSPDGTRLAYHGTVDTNADGVREVSIFITDATITDETDRQITAITGPTTIDFQPDWSHPGAAMVMEPAEPAQETAMQPAEAGENTADNAAEDAAEPPAPVVDVPTLQAAPTLEVMDTPAPVVAQPTAVPTIAQPTVAPTDVVEPTAIPTEAPPTPPPPPTDPPQPQPLGPLQLVYLSRTADTTGDGFIDARDRESLVTTNADGSNKVQITGIDTDDDNPKWSPDRQWIAYEARADTNGDGLIRAEDHVGIYVVAANGSSIMRVTPVNMFAAGPSWAPDAQRLVFYGTTVDSDGDGLLTRSDNTNIYIVNRDGTGLIQVTLDRTDDLDPDWSPDGTRLAFASRAADTSGDGLISLFDNASIFVVNADGSNLTQITVNATEDQGPKWSPDGGHLAFVSWTADTNQDGFISTDMDYPSIYVIEPNGANLTRITDPGTYAASPAWDPTGRRIAYVVRQDNDGDGVFRFNDAGHLFMADYTGSIRAQLTDDTFGTLLPSWSPDGALIAFHTWRDVNGDGQISFPDNPSIYTITVDGATRTRISDDAFADFNPVWAP